MKQYAQYLREKNALNEKWAKVFEGEPTPYIPQPTPEPTKPPTGNKMLLRVFFYGMNHSYKKPLDIRINGKWYNFSQDMKETIKLNGAVGTVIEVESPITNIELRESQIRFQYLNEGGFGWTNIKYGAVPASDNIHSITESKWSSWENGKANHTARWGDLNRNWNDDNFFKINVPTSFNDTGQFAIYVSGYGENRP